jgi:hypothetical protein
MPVRHGRRRQRFTYFDLTITPIKPLVYETPSRVINTPRISERSAEPPRRKRVRIWKWVTDVSGILSFEGFPPVLTPPISSNPRTPTHCSSPRIQQESILTPSTSTRSATPVPATSKDEASHPPEVDLSSSCTKSSLCGEPLPPPQMPQSPPPRSEPHYVPISDDSSRVPLSADTIVQQFKGVSPIFPIPVPPTHQNKPSNIRLRRPSSLPGRVPRPHPVRSAEHART